MKKFNLTLSLLVVALGLVFATGCKDACEKENPCVNGTCADVDGEAVCTCTTGWEGDNCDTEERDKFEGSYTWTDGCNPGANFSSVIGEGAAVTEVTITNILGDQGTVTAEVSGTTITIPVQTITDSFGLTWTVQSTVDGTYANNAFEMTVRYTVGSSSEDCIVNFTKQ